MNKRLTIGLLTLFCIFLIDVLTPLGIAVGVLYLCSFLLVLKESTKTIIIFGVLSSSLTIFNYGLQFNPEVSKMVFYDRTFSVMAIIVATIITVRYKVTDQTLNEERDAYIQSLENMLIITSHRVRQPVANCLGLMEVIDFTNPSKEDLRKIYSHLKTSSYELDKFTKELTDYIYQAQVNHKSLRGKLSSDPKRNLTKP